MEIYKSDYGELPEMKDACEECTLFASYTANNGIRLRLEEDDNGIERSIEFDFELEQAEAVGNALLRWAADSRKERDFYQSQNLKIDQS